MEIVNKHILVTGAGSGMGKATALHLGKLGAYVYVLDLNETAATAVANEIDGTPIVCDVSDARMVAAVFSTSRLAEVSLDVCINCAGVAPAQKLIGREGALMELTHYEKTIQINQMGTFYIMRYAVESMCKKDESLEDRGVVINTASVAAYEGQIGQLAYSASKGAIVAMTLPAARDLQKQHIRVNCIAPGLVDTPLMIAIPEKVKDHLLSHLAYPKRYCHVSEYARLAQHFIENAYLNGTTIRLDAGLRMP